jgi:hypothetical protein
MDRRKFLKNTGWSFLGLAASGSLLGSCAAGSKEAKKIMPSASNLKTDNMQSMYPIRLFQTAVTTPFIPFIIKAGYPNSKSTRKWGAALGFIWELSVLMPEKAMPAR